MDLVVLPQHWAAILSIIIMIGAIIFAFIKKTMVSYALIISNIIIFIITMIFYEELVYGISAGLPYAGLGFRSIYLTEANSPQIYTIFTSMFIHGGFPHIFGNMLIFFLIGIPFEQRVGAKKFLVIYLLAGMIGTLTHAFLNIDSSIPLIGASGAIFGIMGAFAASYPNDKVHVPIGFIVAFLVKIRVIYAVAFYAAIETLVIWWESQAGPLSNTAHFAHIGGLIGGAILAWILIRNQPKHDKKGETIYYDSYVQNRPRKIDTSTLRTLANTPELKDMLNRIENEDVPQVKDLWIEHFIEKAVCPKCGSRLNHFNQKIWCDKCGFKTKY